MPKKIFKCEAEGDVLYFKASSEDKAKKKLFDLMGEIPESLLTWTEISELPEGAELS